MEESFLNRLEGHLQFVRRGRIVGGKYHGDGIVSIHRIEGLQEAAELLGHVDLAKQIGERLEATIAQLKHY